MDGWTDEYMRYFPLFFSLAAFSFLLLLLILLLLLLLLERPF